jgi:cytochrome c biogenesis protein CcdA
MSGLLYTLGRVVCYAFLGILVAFSLLSIPQTSYFLQTYMNKVLGPVLIVAGLLLFEVFSFAVPGVSISEKVAEKFKNIGVVGSLPLGVLFALSFCPVSAALFFGSLIPLALKNSSSIVLPSVYGIGTGLPVLAFALLTAIGIRNVGNLFNKIALIERWARKCTGLVFILAGSYYVLTHIFYLDLGFF